MKAQKIFLNTLETVTHNSPKIESTLFLFWVSVYRPFNTVLSCVHLFVVEVDLDPPICYSFAEPSLNVPAFLSPP